MNSPFARTAISTPASKAIAFEGATLAELGMMLGAQAAKSKRDAEISRLLDDSHSIVRASIAARRNGNTNLAEACYSRFVAIEIELMALGLDLT